MDFTVSDGHITISYGSYQSNSKIPHIIVYGPYHIDLNIAISYYALVSHDT